MKKIFLTLGLIPILGLSAITFVSCKKNNISSNLDQGLAHDFVVENGFKVNKQTGELVSYEGNKFDITIPSKIQNIEIKSIGKYAFHNKNILRVKFPEGIVEIKENAFSQNIINQLTLPQSLEIINSNAFFANKIQKINFAKNSNLKIIGDYSFFLNEIKGELSIPSSVEKIGVYAFAGEDLKNSYSNKISTLKFEQSSQLKSIGYGAFAYNAIKGKLEIPSSVELIDKFAFTSSANEANSQNKNKISELIFGKNSQLKKIGNSAFSINEISKLTIPSSVIFIEENAFATNKISELIFEQNSKLTFIGVNGFFNNELTKLELPHSLKRVGHASFGANKLKELHFGRNLIYIGYQAFAGNGIDGQLNNISKVNSTIEGNFVFYYGDDNGNPIEVWNNAFTGNSSIKNIYINNKVKLLNDNVFDNNANKITKQETDYDLATGKLKNESINSSIFFSNR